MSTDPLGFVCIAFFVLFAVAFTIFGVVGHRLTKAADANKKIRLADKAKREAAYITQAKFQQIKVGMSFEQVVSALGPPEQELAAAGMDGLETTVFMWRGGIIANATLTFQNGILVAKSQVGL
jgi:hypothetical protein